MSKKRKPKRRIKRKKGISSTLPGIFSVALISLGIYYLLVSIEIFNAKIIWFKNYLPADPSSVFAVGIIAIFIGILLGKEMWKNVFSE